MHIFGGKNNLHPCVYIRKCFKVNGYTFRESNNVIFIFSSHLFRGQILKKSICSRQSKLFPIKIDPVLERLCPPGKQSGSHYNLKKW